MQRFWHNTIKGLIALLTLAASHAAPVSAQDAVLKTNLLYDALLSPTLAIEGTLGPKWTVELSGTLNNWTINNHRWKQWMVMPEVRYWFCQRFSGHFLGAHMLGGQYNFGNIKNNIHFLGTDFSKLTDHRYQGWMVGAGLAYGYSWILDRHWNIEAEIGLGYIYTRYDEFTCIDCGKKLRSNVPHHYVGPTKLALNLIYSF